MAHRRWRRRLSDLEQFGLVLLSLAGVALIAMAFIAVFVHTPIKEEDAVPWWLVLPLLVFGCGIVFWSMRRIARG